MIEIGMAEAIKFHLQKQSGFHSGSKQIRQHSGANHWGNKHVSKRNQSHEAKQPSQDNQNLI